MSPHTAESKKVPGCPLCETDGGVVVWVGDRFRVVRTEEAPGFPVFYRVIWNTHAAEFSNLAEPDRVVCMAAVALVEKVLRNEVRPDKINLAALGNMVAHLHWHVIARFEGDSHFPASVWAAPVRERDAAHEAALARRLPVVDAVLAARLAAAF